MELNSNQIQEILPHRYPFLLVDRILECEPGKMAKGIKCVSANEMHFLGHFPQKHVMPGVLIIEALAQTGAVALLMEEEIKERLHSSEVSKMHVSASRSYLGMCWSLSVRSSAEKAR